MCWRIDSSTVAARGVVHETTMAKPGAYGDLHDSEKSWIRSCSSTTPGRAAATAAWQSWAGSDVVSSSSVAASRRLMIFRLFYPV